MSFNRNSTSAAGTGNLPEHTQIEVGFVFSVYCFVDHFCRFVFFHCIVCSSSITDFWLSFWYIQDFRQDWAILYLQTKSGNRKSYIFKQWYCQVVYENTTL